MKITSSGVQSLHRILGMLNRSIKILSSNLMLSEPERMCRLIGLSVFIGYQVRILKKSSDLVIMHVQFQNKSSLGKEGQIERM